MPFNLLTQMFTCDVSIHVEIGIGDWYAQIVVELQNYVLQRPLYSKKVKMRQGAHFELIIRTSILGVNLKYI